MANNLKFNINFKVRENSNVRQGDNKNAFFIEGGGTKGVYAIGILKYLFENNPYFNINDVELFGGTSVGSYLAAALSIGYDKNDIESIVKIIDIGSLIDSKYMFMVTLYRFTTQGYLYDDTGRESIVKEIINHKLDDINHNLGFTGSNKLNANNLRFSHLRLLIKNFPHIYKHLLVNTIDINRGKEIIITTLEEKWDNIKLLDALLASSAIPFIFKPTTLYHNPTTNTYSYDKVEDSLPSFTLSPNEQVKVGDCLPSFTTNILVDGGTCMNNPLDYFLLNEEKYSNYNLWLLKFTSQPEYVNINGTFSLLKQLVDYLVSGKNNIKMELIHENYNISTINLHSNAGTLDIYTQDQIKQIIDDIYNQCLDNKLFFGN